MSTTQVCGDPLVFNTNNVYEYSYASDLVAGTSVTFTTPIDPPALTFVQWDGANSSEVIRICQDGTVKLNPSLTIDQASEEFWTRVEAVGVDLSTRLKEAEKQAEMWKAAAIELADQLRDQYHATAIIAEMLTKYLEQHGPLETDADAPAEAYEAAYDHAMKVIG